MVNRRWGRRGSSLLMAAALLVILLPTAGQMGGGQKPSVAPAKDISGTWSAMMNGPMGQMEIIYRLRVTDRKITGTAETQFGKAPIVDGAVDGDAVRFTVKFEFFGNSGNADAKGKIVGDTLILIPAFPPPPPGVSPGKFNNEPLTFHRKA